MPELCLFFTLQRQGRFWAQKICLPPRAEQDILKIIKVRNLLKKGVGCAMYAHVVSLGVTGLDGYPVTVETHISGGLPKFAIRCFHEETTIIFNLKFTRISRILILPRMVSRS